VSAAITTASNTDVNVSGTASLNLSGGIANNNSLTLSNTGSGTLHVSSITGTGTTAVASGSTATPGQIRQDTLTVNGSLKIDQNGDNSGMMIVKHLSLAGSTGAWTAKLDLNDNDLIVNYDGFSTPFQTIKDQVKMG